MTNEVTDTNPSKEGSIKTKIELKLLNVQSKPAQLNFIRAGEELNKTPKIHSRYGATFSAKQETPYLHDPNLTSAGPLIPYWTLHPRQEPNQQIIPTLKVIEEMYLGQHLSYQIYDRWMSLNSGEYQLGTSPELLQLWDDRMDGVQRMTTTSTLSVLEKGQRVARRMDDTRKQDPPLIWEHVKTWTVVGFTLVPCRDGTYHLKGTGRIPRSRVQCKVLNRLFPWYEHEDRQKTNLDLASFVFQALRRGHKTAIYEAFRIMPVGANNTTTTAMCIAAVGNPSWPLIYKLVRDDKTCCLTTQGFKAYFKAVSVAVRRTSRWLDGSIIDVSQVAATAYFELTIGRAGNLTDWEEEKAKRCGPNLPLRDPFSGHDFLQEVRIQLVPLVKDMLPKGERWGTWEKFVLSRQRWSPSGSAAGAKIEVDGETIRVNKHTYFEITPTDEILAWLDSTPKLEARGSEKMEPGKSRAIYGTSPLDQSIVTYLISPLESGMNNIPEFVNGHSGAHEVADVKRRLQAVQEEHLECTMLDYADFNYQHTLAAQWLLFDVIEEAVLLYRNKDLTKAAQWVKAAQLNQWVRFPNDTKWYRVTQGMFSGVRSTDFTNTILNLAYFRAAAAILQRNTGLAPIGLMSLHKGDDVWISNRSRLWACQLYKVMAEAGFIFQPGKQMFDLERGEFLRVLYTREGAIGYMMRAVAALLVKPIQSVQEITPQGKASAQTSQVHLLYRRGLSLDACDILWWSLIPHSLRLKLPSGAGVGIPVGVAMKAFTEGGLDLGPPMTMGSGGVTTKPLPSLYLDTDQLAQAVEGHMSHDWIKEISKVVKTPFNADKLGRILKSANVSDSLRPVDRKLGLRRLEKELQTWREKVSRLGNAAMGKRVALDVSPSRFSSADWAAKRLNYALDCYAAVGMEPGRPLNVVDVLVAGMAASPLRDIASAQAALDLSTLASARQCLLLASDRMIARQASSWLESLVQRLGEDVTVSIIQGIRGIGMSYEAVLHPIMLSLVSKRATDLAVADASANGIRTRMEWDSILQKWMAGLTAAMIQHHNMHDWSHY